MIKKSPFNDKTPKIHPTAFIANDAVIIGDVEIGAGCNIWFGAIIRGDECQIKIGENTSIQENVVIHSDPETEVIIGRDIIVGHSALIHGPGEIGDSSMVGLSATTIQGSILGKGSVLAAGSLLRGESEVFSLYAGVPAVKKKTYGDDRIEIGIEDARKYVERGQKFKEAGLGQEIPEEFLMKN